MGGQVIVPDDFWNKRGLFPLSRVVSDGNCAIEQLAVCVTQRSTLGNKESVVEQCVFAKDLFRKGGVVDKAFEKLYPGATRDDPFKPWKERTFHQMSRRV